ncbi:class II glutamine amidotransferase domain-containing protein [Acidisphaera rubrifaciens]|uniref:Glutamine amidotransferase n=1 Tax=Acidisphaera rubrifaciens HS-AP3 TaxID=1231350 RepID=A0A0D6P9W0_9PROT|nr:glutamine amidotransferase [Acidisphaera rubrifaciens]GAN78126.1 glutamine amidotransferase [Acidisphaera rubrifaciens HS-AP3]
MCGIAGLFLKSPALEGSLGALLAGMLDVLAGRGPDSTGFAIYGDEAAAPGMAAGDARVRLTLRGLAGADAPGLTRAVAAGLEGGDADLVLRDDHAVLLVPEAQEAAARALIARVAPSARVVASGRRIELYKGVGLPAEVATRFDLAAMRGTHAIGHTRMATESAVTVAAAHPFSTGPDQCLVHNGSLSNHNALRRTLRREGLAFETENDTEVAAGYLTWRMRQGMTLEAALAAALDDLDGFYTFVVATRTGFGVLRDPIACKPAVMAETGDYVAFASEYRALAGLPGIEAARLFEPDAARVYVWERAA